MSSTPAASGPGGVRNLRAMFETKTNDSSTSPPSRGRSPADTDGSAPSRPLSKVRASFVAVERPEVAGQGQQWGLRKASDVGVMADANGPKVPSAVIVEERRDEETAESEVIQAKENKIVESTSIGLEASKQEGANEGGLGAILKGSAFEEPAVEGGTATKSAPPSKSSTKPKTYTDKGTDTEASSSSIVKKLDEAKKNHRPPPKGSFVDKDVKPVKPSGGRIHPRISTTAPAAPKPSPTTPKTPTLPKTTKMASTNPNGPTKATDAAEATGAKNDAGQLSPKEKPRSSTTKPAHASAPTAVSAAKTNGEGKEAMNKPSVPSAVTAKKTNSVKPEKKETKAPTMATATASSVAKKAPRASFASQTNGKDRPKSRASINSKAPDESFLARMTRPTTSSASKAHEKVKVDSPPREKRRQSLQKPKARASLVGSAVDAPVKKAEPSPPQAEGQGQPVGQES